MATPKVFKFEDSQTGKIYQIEGDPDTTEAEAIEYLGTLGEDQLPQFEYKAPNAMLGANAEQTVVTKELEEVPEAREYLRDQFWNRKDFTEVQAEFNARFPGAELPEDMKNRWAENRAYADTPEGRQFFRNNDPIAPVNRATGLEDPEAPDSMIEEFVNSSFNSMGNIANSVIGFGALGADLVGADETAAEWTDTFLQNQAALGLEYPSASGQAVDIRSFEDFGMWASSVFGQLVPEISSSLGAGLAGGLIGRKIVERKAADFVEQQVANGVARDVAQAEVNKQLQKATLQGGIGGAAAASEVQSTGAVYGDTYGATGEGSPWTSLLAGTAVAALDTVLPARLLSKIGGEPAKEAIAQSLIKRMGKEGASTFLLEGGTEALQTIIEQLPAGQGIDWDQVLEAGLRGGFGGAGIGAGVGVYESTRNRKANPPAVPTRSTIPEGSVPIPVPSGNNKRRTKGYREEIQQTVTGMVDRINTLTNTWENAPEFEVYDNFTGIKGLNNGAIGAIRDGKVVIHAENAIKEAARRNVPVDNIISAVTFHEGLGHHGLDLVFGQALDDKLVNILENSTVYQQRVNKWLQKNKDAYAGDPNRDIRALEEIMAEGSENGQLPASFVNVMKNTIKDFGRRMGIDMQYSTREVETILGMAHAAVVSGKGRNAASNQFKFMYLGEGADTAEISRLRMAEYSERKGLDVGPSSNTRKTLGWFKGPDNKWRFEISDKKAAAHTLNDENIADLVYNLPDFGEVFPDDVRSWRYSTGLDALKSEDFPLLSLPLDMVLDHPELFEAYPELRDITVHRVGAEKAEPNIKNNHGSFHPKAQAIYINSSLEGRDAISTLLHEVQHAVQTIEGFAKGGNPDSAILSMPDEHIFSTARNYLKWQKGRLKDKKNEFDALKFAFSDPDAKLMAELDRKVQDLEEYLATEPVHDDELERWVREGSVQELEEASLAQFEAEQRFLAKLGTGRGELTEQQEAELDEVYEFFQTYPEEEARINYLKHLQKETISGTTLLDRLVKSLGEKDRGMVELFLFNDSNVSFQAYQSLFGEVEARDVQQRMDMGDFEREDTVPYTGEGIVNPDEYVIDMADDRGAAMASSPEELLNSLGLPVRDTYSSGSLKPEVDDRLIRDDQLMRRQAQRNRVEQDRLAAIDRGIDPESIGLPRYMMMSSPDKVEFTPEEIAAMDPDDIFEAENALAMLERMTEGYTPVLLSNDELKEEAELRGFSAAELLRSKTVEPGELAKKLFMYDIAANKLQDKITTLYGKMQSGQASAKDMGAHAQALYQMQEITQKIFDVQGEIGRSLAAMKTINFTKRRVKGVMETVAQFRQGSPFEYLNDPDEYYKFATSIQQQIADGKEKMKSKGMEFAGNALNLPRALMSTLDMSAPLRQGLFLIHKGAWWRSFANMFRYFGSEQAFKDLQEEIAGRPTYGEMQRANLALSNADGKLSQREEDFQTEWAQKIPGFGKLVRASERAYVGFLNKLRADVFDQLVDKLPEGYTTKDLQDIARFINAASGRGNLPKAMQGSAPVLNALLFSPRLMASRIVMTTALVDPRTYVSMNKTARNEYIKSILAVGSTAALILSLAALGGAEVEKDPRSSDFAKIKVGNTRYDILGGEGQYITLASRLWDGSTKTADGEIKKYGSKFGQTTRKDALYKFIENKAAPVPSFVLDYMRGTNAIGEKFEFDKALLERFTPMIIGDIADNSAEVGLPQAAAMGVPSFFGVGVSSYKQASLDATRELEGPDFFEMKTAVDGEYPNAVVEDGVVTLDDEAREEWSSRINFYVKEWMKDEMASPDWKTLTAEERKEIIADVRKDARKEAKLDMLEILQIPEETEE